MDVIFNLLGHVVVDDVLDVGKVQTLSSHVRRDQHILTLSLELADRPVALILALTSVNRHRLDAFQQQILVDVVDVTFVLAEDEHGRRGLLETLQKVHDLRLLLHVLHLLYDVQVRGTRAAHVYYDGVDQRGFRKLTNLFGHRRREQQRLPLRLEEGVDVADVVLEPEVHHAIRLVQAEVLADVEVHPFLVQ